MCSFVVFDSTKKVGCLSECKNNHVHPLIPLYNLRIKQKGMLALKLLDVTLRDGGHLTNFHITEQPLACVLEASDASGVDYIEIGYRNGSIAPIKDIGIMGLCPDPFIESCRRHVHHSKLAIMAHPQNITRNDCQSLKALGVSMLRLCTPVGRYEESFKKAQMGLEAGLEVSVNFIHVSQYEPSDLFDILDKLSCVEPTLVYFADSNGCMHPARLRTLIKRFKDRYSMPLGFHAHDNLGLAMANAMAAMDEGVDYLDGSLAGAGKGIGNLKLEFLVAYLNSMQRFDYRLSPLIGASNMIREIFPQCGYVSEGEFMRGICDYSTKQMNEVLSRQEREVQP